MEKAENGSLGFALVGGRNGRAILIKAISPDSIADLDGRLQVGDILLKVKFAFHHVGGTLSWHKNAKRGRSRKLLMQEGERTHEFQGRYIKCAQCWDPC